MDRHTEDIILEARSWLGTRFHHAQCCKGAGVDCVQLLIAIGKKFGYVPEEYRPPFYHMDWAMHNSRSVMKKEVEKFCEEVVVGAGLALPDKRARLGAPLRAGEGAPLQAGDIILFHSGQCASHAGIYVGDGNVIHACLRSRKVVETPLAEIIKTAPLDSVWRFCRHSREGGNPGLREMDARLQASGMTDKKEETYRWR